MDKTGTLKTENGESRVDGTLLGRKVASGQDPYGAATDYLIDSNCHDGDCVTVSGVYQGQVLYIDGVQKLGADKCKPGAAENLMLAERVPVEAKARSVAPKKAAKKASATPKLSGPAKATKKTEKKSVVKNQTVVSAPAKVSRSKKAAKKKTKGR